LVNLGLIDFLEVGPLRGPNATRRGEGDAWVGGCVGGCELLSFGGMEPDRDFNAAFVLIPAPSLAEFTRLASFLGFACA